MGKYDSAAVWLQIGHRGIANGMTMNFKNMKNQLIFWMLALFFTACESEEMRIDRSQLSGNWRLTEQYENDLALDPYTQTWTIYNTSDQSEWKDTLKFGATTFHFTESDSMPIFNSFTLKSEHIRDLYGSWSLKEDIHELTITSQVSPYMNEDTLINDRRYAFSSFVNFKAQIKDLTPSRMVWETSATRFVFEKIF